MRNIVSKLFFNISSALVEKSLMMILQFVTSLLVIRYLPKEQYGIIGITAGYHALIAFFNISPENIFLKEYGRVEKYLNRHISVYFFFSCIKALVFLFMYLTLGLLLNWFYSVSQFFYASCYLGSLTFLEICVSTFQIVFVVQFRQYIVTYIRCLNALASLLLTVPFMYFPTLQYLALRNFIVSLIMMFVWAYAVKKYLNFSYHLPRIASAWLLIKRSMVSYSFWTYLNGMTTNFIYKMDTIVLSFFMPLYSIGNYSIVLNILNYFGDFFSQVINYQCSVAISRTNNQQGLKLLGGFTRILILLSLILCAGAFLTGKSILNFLFSGDTQSVQEAYSYLLPILLGLLLLRFIFSPLASWIFLKQSIVSYTSFVILPLLIMSFPVYFCGGYFGGGIGVAWGNVVIGCISAILILLQARNFNVVIEFNPLKLFNDFNKVKSLYANKEVTT